MCELLAMSSLEPATLSISLEAFSERGGLSAPHKDGWGAAFYSGRDARRLRETGAASRSSGIRFLREQEYRSNLVLAHVRQATKGAVSLENTQPFARELGGRMHVFAHNGDLIGLEDATAADLGRFRPIGDTDSEHAFCLLLARLEPLWAARDTPSLESRLAAVTAFAALLRPSARPISSMRTLNTCMCTGTSEPRRTQARSNHPVCIPCAAPARPSARAAPRGPSKA